MGSQRAGGISSLANGWLVRLTASNCVVCVCDKVERERERERIKTQVCVVCGDVYVYVCLYIVHVYRHGVNINAWVLFLVYMCAF